MGGARKRGAPRASAPAPAPAAPGIDVLVDEVDGRRSARVAEPQAVAAEPDVVVRRPCSLAAAAARFAAPQRADDAFGRVAWRRGRAAPQHGGDGRGRGAQVAVVLDEARGGKPRGSPSSRRGAARAGGRSQGEEDLSRTLSLPLFLSLSLSLPLSRSLPPSSLSVFLLFLSLAAAPSSPELLHPPRFPSPAAGARARGAGAP